MKSETMNLLFKNLEEKYDGIKDAMAVIRNYIRDLERKNDRLCEAVNGAKHLIVRYGTYSEPSIFRLLSLNEDGTNHYNTDYYKELNAINSGSDLVVF